MLKFNYLVLFYLLLCVGWIASPLCAKENTTQEKILFYDADYGSQYAGDIETASNYFITQGFKVLNTTELNKWIVEHLKNGTCHDTTILHLSDITPKSLVLPWDKTSLLYQYCLNGGRWVAPGGNTLYTFLGEKDLSFTVQGSDTDVANRYITNCFNVRRVYGLKGKGREITDAGKKWGLANGKQQWLNYLASGVPTDDAVALVKSKTGNAALVWLKNVNPKYPNSGLVGLTTRLNKFVPILEMVYRLCDYNGKSVLEVPKKDWLKKNIANDFEIKFITKVGNIPRKAYQRGETIPLTIRVGGEKYTNQKVVVALSFNNDILWQKIYLSKKRRGLVASEKIETQNIKCGEYTLKGYIEEKEIASEKIWICPSRRHNAFPILTAKMHRRSSKREQVALEYLRDQNVNAMIFDLYQLQNAATNKTVGKRFGNYLDLLLRNNLMASARPTSMNLYTTDDKEKLVLYDGTIHSHGANHDAMGWRGYLSRQGSMDKYRAGLRKQVSLLRNSKSPIILPYFTTNDDGSMGGNYDFNLLTMDAFHEKTGLSRKDLPPLKRFKSGNNVFMPIVAEGIIADDHPWLQYFRFHSGNYNKIAQAAMEGIESAWPGSLVADTGCMAGPLYMPRAYYPPLSFAAYNTASFYQYLFWFNAYHFAIETAHMGNRDKPVGLLISAAYIAWGETFQRGVLYRVLAEAPKFIGLWSLDARQTGREKLEENTWKGTKSVAGKVATIAKFIKLQKSLPRKGALFFGLAQNCFNTKDLNFRPYSMRTALDNFTRAGASLDLLSTEEIMKGALAKYNVIFINSHQWITAGAKKAMENYIRHGGVVVYDSQTTIEIKGAIKSDGPFGVNLGDVGKPSEVKRCEKLVETYLKPLLVKASSPNTIVRVNTVKKTPLAWVIDVESSEEIHALQRAQTDDWIQGVPDYLRKKVKNKPFVEKKISLQKGQWAYDLWNHQELPLTISEGQNIGTLTVERFGATPVALYRDRIHSLKTKTSPQKIFAGDTYVAFFELFSDKYAHVRGVVPAQVTVYAPNGKEAWEYGGNRLISNGSLAIEINTADNDAIGIWKIKVKELCSGKTSEAEFILEKSIVK